MGVFLHLLLLWTISWSSSASKEDENAETAEDLDENYLSDFDHTLVELNHLFVDKTTFIVHTFEKKFTDELILRGRRWGKTFNLNMLRIFFGIRHDKNGSTVPWNQRDIYFKGGKLRRRFLRGKNTHEIINLKPLQVSNYPEVMRHMGNHPVIYLSFQNCGTSFEIFSNCLIDKISRIIESKYYNVFLTQHCRTVVYTSTIIILGQLQCKELLQNPRKALKSESILENSLFIIGALLTEHFHQQPVILIDELDYPLHNMIDNQNDLQRTRQLIRNLYRNTFRIKFRNLKGIAAGLLRWHGEEMPADVLDILRGSILDQSSYEEFGFTKQEIESMLEKGSYNVTIQDIETWYGGFYMNDKKIFNPSSIINCLLRNGTYGPFRIKNNSLDSPSESNFLSNLMLSDLMQKNLQKLYCGYAKTIRITLFEDFRIMNLILMGYLSAIPNQIEKNYDGGRSYKAIIPNRETRDFFLTYSKTWIVYKLQKEKKRQFCQDFETITDSYDKISVFMVEEMLYNYTFPIINVFETDHCEAIFATLLVLEDSWKLNRTFPKRDEFLDCVISLSPKNPDDKIDPLFIAIKYTNEARYEMEMSSWKETLRQKTINNLMNIFSPTGNNDPDYSKNLRTLFTYLSDSRIYFPDTVSISTRSTVQIIETELWKVFVGVYQMRGQKEQAKQRKSKIIQVLGKIWPFHAAPKTSTIPFLQPLKNDKSESLICI